MRGRVEPLDLVMEASVIPKILNFTRLTIDGGTLAEEVDFKGFTPTISVAFEAIHWY